MCQKSSSPKILTLAWGHCRNCTCFSDTDSSDGFLFFKFFLVQIPHEIIFEKIAVMQQLKSYSAQFSRGATPTP